jgi:hypothetical protein
MQSPFATRFVSNRKRRLAGIFGLAVLCLVGLSACNRNHAMSSAVPLMMAHADLAERAHSTLSREHSLTVEVPESDLAARFQRLADRCMADVANHCTILQSDVSSGQAASGLIKLRIDPKAVADLVAFVATLGTLERQSTSVEDLGEAIQDTQSRIEMLTNYRKQLLDLQAKAVANVDAAIKIASELSTVQGNLEQATGQAAYQTKRTTTDIVSINFAVTEQKAFWRPVREAIRDFFGNLSNGLSQAITAVAYIVPWLLVVIPGFYLVRFLWRRRGR